MSGQLIVLDTGVVVSALIGSRDAAAFRVCRAIGTGEVRLAISDRFLTELVEVVRRRYAEGLIRDAARAFEVALDLGTEGEKHHPETHPWPKSISDPGDWWIAELAYETGADFIVASDPHVTEATLPIPVEILTPQAFAHRAGL
ncbi:MAG: PIN domain-containing protein [Rubrobacteraceae bacterium]